MANRSTRLQIREGEAQQSDQSYSVLFTADLRAFSERLTTKIEVKEILEEECAKVLAETQVKAEVLTPINVKREFEDENKSLIAVKEVTVKRPVKRRRKV